MKDEVRGGKPFRLLRPLGGEGITDCWQQIDFGLLSVLLIDSVLETAAADVVV